MNKQGGSYNKTFAYPSQMSPSSDNEIKHSNPIPLVKASSSQYFEICSAEGFTNDMREKYMDAIEYVNFCHRVMNKLLRKKCADSGDMEDHLNDFKIPETANFLSILDLLLTESERIKNCNQKNEPKDNLYNNMVRNISCRNNQDKKFEVYIPNKITEIRNSGVHCTEDEHQQQGNLETKTRNNKTRMNNKDAVNVSKSLLQNNIKQFNLGDNNIYNIHRQDSYGSIREELENGIDISNQTSSDEEECHEYSSNEVEKLGKNLHEHQEKAHDIIDNSKGDIKELFTEADYNIHLMDLIKKQIHTFLQSPNSDLNNAYINKRENLDIDNFRIVDISSKIDIDNYSIYDKETLGKSVDQLSDNLPPNLNISSSSSSQSQLTYEYKGNNYENIKVANNRKIITSTSVNHIQYVQKREKEVHPVKRVEYTCPNISSTKSFDTKLDARQILMHGEMNDSDEDNSTILSDDEFVTEVKITNTSDPITSVEKVINAFSHKNKIQKGGHNSKQKQVRTSETLKTNENLRTADNFNHPLNLSQKEIHNLSKEVLTSMGLFTESGEMRPKILAFLKDEETNKKSNSSIKKFRRSRTCSEEAHPSKKAEAVTNLSYSCDSSSDIKTDYDTEKHI